MDKRLIYGMIGGGIVYALHLIERRLCSLENRLVVGINAQTSIMRESIVMEYEVELEDGDDDVEDFLK